MNLGRDKPEDKEQWRSSEREPVRICIYDPLRPQTDVPLQKLASMALWNHAGTGILTALHSESSIRAIEYPSLSLHKTSPAHVGGVTSLALDPRGRYLASGGVDSIVNLFDLEDWISARTITSCEYVLQLPLR